MLDQQWTHPSLEETVRVFVRHQVIRSDEGRDQTTDDPSQYEFRTDIGDVHFECLSLAAWCRKTRYSFYFDTAARNPLSIRSSDSSSPLIRWNKILPEFDSDCFEAKGP